MLYTMFHAHPVRMFLVLVLSLGFSLANVLLPVCLNSGSLTRLVILWFLIHLSGRAQTLLFLPLSISIRARLLNPCPTLILQPPKVSRQSIQQQVYRMDLNTRWVETLLFQGIPAGISLGARLFILQRIHPQVTTYAVCIIIASCIIWSVMIVPVKKAIHQYHQACAKLNVEQVDVLLDQIFYNEQRSTEFAQRLYNRQLVHKESLKSICALWVVVVLAVGFYTSQSISDISTLYTFYLLWLGFSDQIWSLWNVLVECSISPYTPMTRQTLETIPIQRILFKNTQVLSNTKPINQTLFAGDIAWVEGKNGVGKTSLLRALKHQQALHGGSIILEPTSRASICVVTAYMQPSRGRVCDYLDCKTADLVGLKHHIESLPSQYQTSIDHLPNWSMGMLQKISLGWAIQQNASIYLLDECCHHLPISEELSFYKHLKEYRPKAIIMVVSHQLNRKLFQLAFPDGRHIILTPTNCQPILN